MGAFDKDPLVPAYRCGHTGMYYPADYLKEWGVKYGRGLGPVPCSESLDSIYTNDLPELKYCKSADHIMHAVGTSHAQIDFVMVPQSEFEANQLILHEDDPDYIERGKILRAKQMENPLGQLQQYQAAFAKGKK